MTETYGNQCKKSFKPVLESNSSVTQLGLGNGSCTQHLTLL